MKNRYIVYIEIPDDNVRIKYGYRRFKFTAWLLAMRSKKIYGDNDLIVIICDRKEGKIVYEK